jgi:RNA polymerase sigma-70 factor, ECF subfamily
MNASVKTPEEPQNEAVATLGDLLYADKSALLVTESEWVRVVAAIAAGNQLALAALYERSHRFVYTLAMRLARNKETAEEITLDVYHDIWRRASKYAPADGTVVGWIMNLTRSRAIDRIRFDQRKKRVNSEGADPLFATSAGDAGQVVQSNETAHELRKALQVLTTDERLAIETAYFSELTYAEAARQLSQPLGTVKTRIRSGLGKLRDVLSVDAKAEGNRVS